MDTLYTIWVMKPLDCVSLNCIFNYKNEMIHASSVQVVPAPLPLSEYPYILTSWREVYDLLATLPIFLQAAYARRNRISPVVVLILTVQLIHTKAAGLYS
jgi:hypothetical protein